MGILFKLSKIVSSKTLFMLYNSLILPHLTYGVTVWGSTFESYLKVLQSFQNKAVRAVSKIKWREKITPIYHKYHLLEVEDMHRVEVAKFMHKFSQTLCPRSSINTLLIQRVRINVMQEDQILTTSYLIVIQPPDYNNLLNTMALNYGTQFQTKYENFLSKTLSQTTNLS